MEKTFNPSDVSQDAYVSPQVAGCKFRSQAAIVEATNFKPIQEQPSCAELNLMSLQGALDLLNPDQRARVTANLGGQGEIISKTVNQNDNSVFLEADILTINDSIKSRGDQWALVLFQSSKKSMANGSWILSLLSRQRMPLGTLGSLLLQSDPEITVYRMVAFV